MGSTVAWSSHGPLAAPCTMCFLPPGVSRVGAGHGPNAVCALTGAIHSSSTVTSPFLLSEAMGGVMGNFGTNTSVSPHGTSDGLSEAMNSGWTMKELAGAIVLASAAVAGSLFLGPMDRLRGGGGSNSPGGRGSGGNNNGGGGRNNGETYDNSFDFRAREEGDDEERLAVGIATAPKPYEVNENLI